MRIVILACAIMEFFSLACMAAEKITFSGHPNYPPYMWKEDGKLHGIGIELANTACREFNLDCDIRLVDSWKRAQELTKTGEIDGLVGAYSNEDRRKYMEYTIAYKKDPTQVFVHKDRSFTFHVPEDLIGKRGVAMYGESFGEELDRFIKANLQLDRGYTAKALFENLYAGRVDYILWGYYPWYINAFDTKALDWCVALPTPVAEEGMHVTFSKKSDLSHLVEKFNSLIRKLQQNGTINRWSEKFIQQFQDKSIEGVQ